MHHHFIRSVGKQWLFLAMGLAAVLLSRPVSAAVLAADPFDADPLWEDRDAAEMDVSYNAGFGNGTGSMEGTFAAQGVPAPETDAMRAGDSNPSSGGAFTGDYYANYGAFVPDTASFTFDFYSEDVLPSDVRIRLSDGVNTFSRSFITQVTSTGTWQPITLSLAYAGWVGGTGSDYTNMFSGITFVEVAITRNGEDEQSFFVDNFTLNGDLDNGGGGGGGAVPEVVTGQLVFLGLLFMRRARRRYAARKKTDVVTMRNRERAKRSNRAAKQKLDLVTVVPEMHWDLPADGLQAAQPVRKRDTSLKIKESIWLAVPDPEARHSTPY